MFPLQIRFAFCVGAWCSNLCSLVYIYTHCVFFGQSVKMVGWDHLEMKHHIDCVHFKTPVINEPRKSLDHTENGGGETRGFGEILPPKENGYACRWHAANQKWQWKSMEHPQTMDDFPTEKNTCLPVISMDVPSLPCLIWRETPDLRRCLRRLQSYSRIRREWRQAPVGWLAAFGRMGWFHGLFEGRLRIFECQWMWFLLACSRFKWGCFGFLLGL